MSRIRHYEGPLDCFDMGKGPLVMLIHGAASTAGQWKQLIHSMSDRYHMVAPNLWGYGKSPAWDNSTAMTMQDEIAPILDLIAHHKGDVHVVGHSHGASLATLIATEITDRLASLTIWETNAFHLLNPEKDKTEWQQSFGAFGHFIDHLHDQDMSHVSQEMLDFWMGDGFYAAMPDDRQAFINATIRPVTLEINAVFNSRIPIEKLAPLQDRILHMADPGTAAAAWRVANIIRETLPDIDWREYPGLTHMGPVFHPGKVNPDIIAHIEKWSS